MTQPTDQHALVLDHVSKRFGATRVLEDISLAIKPGEVVAIVGENGAGKSTLMRIITGVLQPTSGQVGVGDGGQRISSVHDARDHGIVLIPQELAYLADDTIANNISLGHWPNSAGLVSRRRNRERARRAMEVIDGPVDVDRRMSELTLSEQQLVEIGKALAVRDSRLLCLDEPTAALNNDEVRRLLEVIKQLKSQGVAMLYVSHRLDELRVIADRILVLRNGRIAAVLTPDEADPATLTAHMLGEAKDAENAENAKDTATRTGSPDVSPDAGSPGALTLRDWRFDGKPQLTGVNLQAAEGEIVGVYGLAGSGIESLARGLGGLLPGGRAHGELTLPGRSGRDLFRHPSEARRHGVVYLPADRKHDGLMLRRSVRENLTHSVSSARGRLGFVSGRRQRQIAEEAIDRFQIKCTDDGALVADLSGGNQQKILFANRLLSRPRVLVLHEPTRGVDVGARAELHQGIRDAARDGVCVLVVTTDIEEVVHLSDRVAVMREGRVARELVGSDITYDKVLRWAATTEEEDSK